MSCQYKMWPSRPLIDQAPLLWEYHLHHWSPWKSWCACHFQQCKHGHYDLDMLSECAYDCTEMKNGDMLTNRIFRCKTYSSCNFEFLNCSNLGFEKDCLRLSYSNIVWQWCLLAISNFHCFYVNRYKTHNHNLKIICEMIAFFNSLPSSSNLLARTLECRYPKEIWRNIKVQIVCSKKNFQNKKCVKSENFPCWYAKKCVGLFAKQLSSL